MKSANKYIFLFFVKILDGPNVTRAQRQEVYDMFVEELGFRVMFIECVCEDKQMLERYVKVSFI